MFLLCYLAIWLLTCKTNRATLYYIKLHCVSFQRHRRIHTAVTVQKRPIRRKIDNFLSRVTLKFDGWPWKTAGHLLFAISSFVPDFITICVFNLESQSGNAEFGSDSMISLCRVTDDLENNMASLLCYFKLCAWFCNHWCIQTGVTIRKLPIWFKIDDFSVWLWNSTDNLEKEYNTFPMLLQALCTISWPLMNSN